MELWQLYDEQGRAKYGQGAARDEVFGKGLLHGASHVWIWRSGKEGAEILLQKRAASKRTWPNRYDISAAGHIDLGEDPLTTAVRETKEEIGLNIKDTNLKLIGVLRAHLVADGGTIENEFQWLYTLELAQSAVFAMQDDEVVSVEWKPLISLRAETNDDASGLYVPHGDLYYETILRVIEAKRGER